MAHSRLVLLLAACCLAAGAAASGEPTLPLGRAGCICGPQATCQRPSKGADRAQGASRVGQRQAGPAAHPRWHLNPSSRAHTLTFTSALHRSCSLLRLCCFNSTCPAILSSPHLPPADAPLKRRLLQTTEPATAPLAEPGTTTAGRASSTTAAPAPAPAPAGAAPAGAPAPAGGAGAAAGASASASAVGSAIASSNAEASGRSVHGNRSAVFPSAHCPQHLEASHAVVSQNMPLAGSHRGGAGSDASASPNPCPLQAFASAVSSAGAEASASAVATAITSGQVGCSACSSVALRG